MTPNLDELQTTLRWFYDYPKVLELRHRSWGEALIPKQLLQEYQASEVLIDEPKFKTSIRQEAEMGVISSASGSMGGTRRNGGTLKSHGSAMTTCTLAKKSKNMPKDQERL